MSFRRCVQIVSLLLFLFLLAGAIFSDTLIQADIFLRLDPGLVVLTAVCGRYLTWGFVPALVHLLLCPLMGRFFCGYICPMGTTLDGGERLFAAFPKKHLPPKTLGSLKYLMLAFLLGASALGFSLVFLGSPLSLVTRFYALIVYPLLSLFAGGTLELLRPAADHFDMRSLLYAQIMTPRFATQFFVLTFFLTLFALVRVSPRFWCRHLCPSGAMLALFSRKPLIRREVSEDCTACGKCVRGCPMSAIPEATPESTLHGECIACRNCEKVCPVNAVSFCAGKKPRRKNIRETGGEEVSERGERKPPSGSGFSRRGFLKAGIFGAGTAAVSLTGLHTPSDKIGEGRFLPPGLLRPPGALPEKSFLARCVRCGECMAACPTNTLQPIWLDAGLPGMFSPALTPRRGFCDPKCHRCGAVCPTEAIRGLSRTDRIWAKTGTAVIFRQKCLAWEFQKSCMVCDEVCPFDAIDFRKTPDSPFAVPHVAEDRCAGCGYCEHFCPVQNQAAIVVSPMGALRLAHASHEEEGRKQGLRLSLKSKNQGYGESVPSPDPESGDAAPGFDE